MILDGREALPLKFSLRASRAFSGKDFSSLGMPTLRQALLDTLNSIMESSGRSPLRPESIRTKFRPCGRDASGVLHTMDYALGVGCSKEEASFLRHHVETTWGGALPLDLGRTAHALAMIYDGDDPLRGPYYLDITADAFGNVGPATALELLKLKGLKVSSVTEMACADGLLDPIASAPYHYNTICSVGPAPVKGDLGTHLVDRWPRPAAVSGEKRMVALVAGGESFVSEAMKQGGRVHVQVEQEDGSPGVQCVRIWRVWPTLPPLARPTHTVARGSSGASDSAAAATAAPAQPAGEAAPPPAAHPAATSVEEVSAAALQQAAPLKESAVPAMAQQPPSASAGEPAAAASSEQQVSEPALEVASGQPGRQEEAAAAEVPGSASTRPAPPGRTSPGTSFAQAVSGSSPAPACVSGHKRPGGEVDELEAEAEEADLQRRRLQVHSGPQTVGTPVGCPVPDDPGR